MIHEFLYIDKWKQVVCRFVGVIWPFNRLGMNGLDSCGKRVTMWQAVWCDSDRYVYDRVTAEQQAVCWDDERLPEVFLCLRKYSWFMCEKIQLIYVWENTAELFVICNSCQCPQSFDFIHNALIVLNLFRGTCWLLLRHVLIETKTGDLCS